ncbi:hypothetical protein [Streptomyces sp. NPDC048442]|uniref:hypothetical protein n=1 Tax=Streptomyces sp. NPDC048442 TaxID=3154823 RepID=UPI0034369D31
MAPVLRTVRIGVLVLDETGDGRGVGVTVLADVRGIARLHAFVVPRGRAGPA